MKSSTTDQFWQRFDRLPKLVQKQARASYQRFRSDPAHPSLQYKQITPDIVSVRVSLSYRSLGYRQGNLIVWTWIGPHAEYDRILRNL